MWSVRSLSQVSNPRLACFSVTISFFLLLSISSTGNAIDDAIKAPHRKFLLGSPPEKVEKPTRFWGETDKCTGSDLVLTQGKGVPLPSGIPTYIVEIYNACASGCDISDIHLECGWFSSARLIDHHIFKRVDYNDCLINNGSPLLNGQSTTFQYANTFSYPLTILSMRCSQT